MEDEEKATPARDAASFASGDGRPGTQSLLSAHAASSRRGTVGCTTTASIRIAARKTICSRRRSTAAYLETRPTGRGSSAACHVSLPAGQHTYLAPWTPRACFPGRCHSSMLTFSFAALAPFSLGRLALCWTVVDVCRICIWSRVQQSLRGAPRRRRLERSAVAPQPRSVPHRSVQCLRTRRRWQGQASRQDGKPNLRTGLASLAEEENAVAGWMGVRRREGLMVLDNHVPALTTQTT